MFQQKKNKSEDAPQLENDDSYGNKLKHKQILS